MKRTLIICFFLLNQIHGNCQNHFLQAYNQAKPIETRHVLFNKLIINPTNLTDSNAFITDFVIYREEFGPSKPTNGLLFKTETGILPKNYSIGLAYESEENTFFHNKSFNAFNNCSFSFDVPMVIRRLSSQR